MNRVTIKDVARQCGYSFKTVSRVVNGVPSVDPQIRERVKAVIAELGYEPNIAARTLRGQRSFAIGLVYEHPVADVQRGVVSVCEEMGYVLQIIPCDAHRSDLAKRIVDIAQRSKLEGVILPPPFSESLQVTTDLRKEGIVFSRIISGRRPPSDASPCVFVNDFQAAYDITSHLLDYGHRRIAFIWGDPAHGSSRERYAGYSAALADKGIGSAPDYVVPGEYTFETGLSAGQALLSLDVRPTAIIGSNDEIAAGALVAARMNGFSVPDDVSIAGFENSRFSQQSWPPLTTASQSTEDIARRATELLIHQIDGHTRGDEEPAKGFVPTLIARGSTAAASSG